MIRPLERIARDAMVTYGLEPDFPAAALDQLAHLGSVKAGDPVDLRALPWSSIDNDDSRDLDQLEVCVEKPGAPTRVLIAIADVDVLVPKDSPLDRHAALNTTSVYTPAIVFPMLPPELSTDRTSLNQDQDRAAMVADMTIDDTGSVVTSDIYRALVRNKAQLTYNAIAAWLEGTGPAPAALARVPGLDAQVRLQDAIAGRLRERRGDEGALEFARSELHPVIEGDGVKELRTETTNRAKSIIENFMVAANGITARFLTDRGFASIRRVVKSPERWARIVDLASQHGGSLPGAPDARALQQFLKARREAEPDTFQDLSLAVIKLLGRGEYIAESAAEPSVHFALATGTYSHSTAPNRRFPDVVTQRLLKAAIDQRPAPYQLPELRRVAEHCTTQEDAANKVERLTGKAAAALWLTPQIGKTFDSVVTGAGPKGTWVRLVPTPVEGRLDRGAEGLDVGDRVRVRLVSTDPRRGFIDFARA
jgi:exoribonuclease II